MDDGARFEEAFEEIFYDILMPIAASLFEAEISPGGLAYEMILQQAILGAQVWYGMYSPKKYHRGMTLSNPGNIQIDHGDVEISGRDLSTDMSVKNISPNMWATAGFKMVNGQWRPGGDVYQFVQDVDISIDVPEDVRRECMAQALQSIFGTMG